MSEQIDSQLKNTTHQISSDNLNMPGTYRAQAQQATSNDLYNDILGMPDFMGMPVHRNLDLDGDEFGDANQLGSQNLQRERSLDQQSIVARNQEDQEQQNQQDDGKKSEGKSAKSHKSQINQDKAGEEHRASGSQKSESNKKSWHKANLADLISQKSVNVNLELPDDLDEANSQQKSSIPEKGAAKDDQQDKMEKEINIELISEQKSKNNEAKMLESKEQLWASQKQNMVDQTIMNDEGDRTHLIKQQQELDQSMKINDNRHGDLENMVENHHNNPQRDNDHDFAVEPFYACLNDIKAENNLNMSLPSEDKCTTPRKPQQQQDQEKKEQEPQLDNQNQQNIKKVAENGDEPMKPAENEKKEQIKNDEKDKITTAAANNVTVTENNNKYEQPGQQDTRQMQNVQGSAIENQFKNNSSYQAASRNNQEYNTYPKLVEQQPTAQQQSNGNNYNGNVHANNKQQQDLDLKIQNKSSEIQPTKMKNFESFHSNQPIVYQNAAHQNQGAKMSAYPQNQPVTQGAMHTPTPQTAPTPAEPALEQKSQKKYENININDEIEWIPSRIREDFIRQYRLFTNQEIKLIKGYDLFKERMNDWVGSDPKLKEDYEKLKKDAQIEEFKFMEKIMSDFEYQRIEAQIKEKLKEIKESANHLTSRGESLEQVIKIRDLQQSKIVKLYQEQQQLIFGTMKARLMQIDERLKLIEYFNKLEHKELLKRYMKRYRSMMENQYYLKQFMHQYKSEYIQIKSQIEELERQYTKQGGVQTNSYDLEKLQAQYQTKNERIILLKKIEEIIQEPDEEIIKNIYNDNDKPRYCENLYQLEKMLQKIFDNRERYSNSRSTMNLQKRQHNETTQGDHNMAAEGGPQKYQRTDDGANHGDMQPKLSKNYSTIPQPDTNAERPTTTSRPQTPMDDYESQRKYILSSNARVIDQIQPMTLEQFRKTIADKCKSIPDEKVVFLQDIKSMIQQQKQEKKEELKQVQYNLNNIQMNQQKTAGHDETGKKQGPLLNLSLETIVSYNNQEKMQRDRIGIIFQNAKSRSWDQYRDYFYQIKGKKNAKELMDKFMVKKTHELQNGSQSKYQKVANNQMPLHLKEDEGLSSNVIVDTQQDPQAKPVATADKPDYNSDFENEFFVGGRYNVCYDVLFQDLPRQDMQEHSQQEGGGVTPMGADEVTPNENALDLEKQQQHDDEAVRGDRDRGASALDQGTLKVQVTDIQEFKRQINAYFKQLAALGFKLADYEKVTEHVAQVLVKRQDSEYVRKQALVWFDILDSQCYLKQFKIANTLTGMQKQLSNLDISIDNSGTKQVQVECHPENNSEFFQNSGRVDVNKIHALFERIQQPW